MEFPELQRAAADAIDSGGLGTPVAVRLVAQLRCDPVRLTAAAGHLLDWAARLLAAQPVRLHVRAGAHGSQLHVLACLAGGPTASLVCGVHPTGGSELHLLILGNRGLVRLEGGEEFDSATLPWHGAAAESQKWIEQGLSTAASVAAQQNLA